MTAFTWDQPASRIDHAPRTADIVAAGILGFVGFVVATVAFAGVVVGSMTTLPAATTAEADRLAAAAPPILLIGIGHIVIAFVALFGSPTARRVSAGLVGFVAIGATMLATAVAAGASLFGLSRGSGASPAADGVAILAVSALVYGAVAIALARGRSA